MTVDEKVKLAENLAKALQSLWEQHIRSTKKSIRPDDIAFKRGEWQRWAVYFRQTGDLERAIQLAEYMACSPTMRSDPQMAAKNIVKVLRGNQPRLGKLSPRDLQEVFGYVGRWLEWFGWEAKHREKGR